MLVVVETAIMVFDMLGKRVVISIFFGLIAAMSIGGAYSGLGFEGKDAVLAVSFVTVTVVTFVVQHVRGSEW